MKTTTQYWKDWWNDFGKRSGGDYQADRGTALRLDELERRSEQQLIEAVDPKPTDVVLDAGCGTGVNLSKFSGRVARMVGMDLSEEMLKRAEKRVQAEKLPNVELVTGNITGIQFPDQSFDKVLCTSVLQYLNEEECALAFREMTRVCRPGGTIVIHAKNSTSLYGLSLRLVKGIARLLRRRTTPDHYRPRAWYERELAKCGGSIVDYDSFGIFTFVPLPVSIVGRLLRLELALVRGKRLKKFGVNYKMTVRLEKSPSPKPGDQK